MNWILLKKHMIRLERGKTRAPRRRRTVASREGDQSTNREREINNSRAC